MRKIKVDIVIGMWRGLIDYIETFSGSKKEREKKALAFLSGECGAEFKTIDDFSNWQEDNQGGDYEYSWQETTVEVPEPKPIVKKGGK